MVAKSIKWCLMACLLPSLAQASEGDGTADAFELAKQKMAMVTVELEQKLAQCKTAEQIVDLPRAEAISVPTQHLLLAVNYHNIRLKNECSGDALHRFYIAGQVVRALAPPEIGNDLPGFELVDDALQYRVEEFEAQARYHTTVSPDERVAIEAKLAELTTPFNMIQSWEQSDN